jgi:hypothetical protein
MFVLTTCPFVQAQDTTMQQYVGKYKIPDAEMQVNVAIDKGALTMTFPAGTFKLKHTGVDSFDIDMGNRGTAVFRRNEVKKINGISLFINDITLEGKKEE